MQRSEIQSFWQSALVCTGLLCCMPMPAQAHHYLLEETTAQGKLTDQFETAQKDYCAVVVRGGAPACLVFSPTTFSPSHLYLTLLFFGSFRHYDEGTYTSKGETPEQARELAQRRQPAIVSNQETAITLRPEVFVASPGPTALVLVTEIQIRPGTEPLLLQYLRNKTLPQLSANHLSSLELYQTTYGGESNRFLLLRRFNTFSQLDGLAAFGEDAGVSPKPPRPGGTSAAVDWLQHVRSTVMRVRSDLSATP